jgi:hypothetical protein
METAAIRGSAKAMICLLLTLTIIAISGCLGGSNIDELMAKGDVQNLTAALNDSNKDTRLQAGKAIGVLMSGKGQRDDPNLSLAYYGTIKTSTDPSLDLTLKALTRTLDDADQDVRMEAIRALGKIGDRRSVDPLVQELKDGDPRIRATSAEALGTIGLKTKAAIPLLATLKDSDSTVKSNAEKALIAMGLEPYPAPRTGTYLLGVPFTSEFEGWTLNASNPGPYNAIFEINRPGERPYVAVFIRAGDRYYIENVPPGDEIYVTYGDKWESDKRMFTENVHRVYVGKATPIPRQTGRREW